MVENIQVNRIYARQDGIYREVIELVPDRQWGTLVRFYYWNPKHPNREKDHGSCSLNMFQLMSAFEVSSLIENKHGPS